MADAISPDPFVSVIIPTHNRCKQLLKSLDALNNQSYNPDSYEVIVVADSCTDNTVDEITKYKQKSGFRIKILCHRNKKAAVSRNQGISKAKGEILLFIDDDIIPDANFIEEHVAEQKKADVVIGYLETVLPEKPDLWHLVARIWWESRFDEMNKTGHIFNYKDLFTGNVSIKTSFIKSAGKFNEHLIRLEDYELGYRLIKTSAKFSFSKDAKGRHFETNNLNIWANRLISESIAFIHLGELYPELRRDLFRETSENNFIKKLVLNRLIPSGVFVRLLLFISKLSQKIKARKLWQICVGIISLINFWRGAAEKFKNSLEFNKWLSDAPDLNNFDYNNFNIDLNSKKILSDDELKLINEKGLRITFDNIDLYSYKPSPGNEYINNGHISFYNNQVEIDKDPKNVVSWEKLFNIRSGHPVKLYDLDISIPLSPIEVKTEYNFIVINLFIKNLPIGILIFDCKSRKTIQPEEIFSEIQLSYKKEIRQYILKESLKQNYDNIQTFPSVSIIVYVNNATVTFSKCLENLNTLEYPDYEIIVLDNSSGSNTVSEEIKKNNYKYKKVQESVSSAWQTGVEESNNEILVFIDENTIVQKNWLNGISRGFRSPNTIAVFGMALPFELRTETQQDYEFYSGAGKVFSGFWIDLINLKYCKKFINSVWGKGTNIAFRRSFLKNIFNKSLSKGTKNLSLSDYIVSYEPSAFVKQYYTNERKSLHKHLNNNIKSFPYYLLTIRNFYSYLFKHGFIVGLSWWLLNWQVKRIVKSLIHLDLVSLFSVLSEIKELISFYYIYKKLRVSFRDL